MKLLWRNRWIDAPRPHPVPASTLIEVEATAPVAPLGAAHGRRIDYPLRKVASFAATDGPRATLRKARSKRAEPAYTGDYHLVVALGRADGARVLALAPRSVPCAAWMLAPSALTRPAPDDLTPGTLGALAAAIAPHAAALSAQLAQSYLYSGMEPPSQLTAILDEALGGPAPPAASNGAAALIPATGGSRGDTSAEILRFASGDNAAGILRFASGSGGSRHAPAAGPGLGGPGAPLAILGAGDYVRIEVAPALASARLSRTVLADREPQIAALAAAELGFAAATTDAAAAIDELSERGIVIVATAHDSHATLAAHALRAGHRVICEKPAVVTPADLSLLTKAADAHPGELEVGFNRRHNPLVERARAELARESGPATIVASIREVDITPDHWYHWPNQGTRVAGNLCHWIDLAVHLLGPGPEPTEISVSPRVSADPTGLDAERAFTIAFDDGSTVALVPTGRGDPVRGVQERIEARRGRLTLHIDDLWRLSGLRAGRPIRSRTLFRDKGHARMYADAVARFASGRPASYPRDDLRRVAEIQLAATALLLSGEPAGAVSELVASPSPGRTAT